MKRKAQENINKKMTKRNSSFSMSFDPAEKIDTLNTATRLVDWDPKTVTLVENGEGTTNITLAFQFNAYDDIISANVPIQVKLPDEANKKIIDFSLAIPDDKLKDFNLLNLMLQTYQTTAGAIKLLEPYSNLALPSYSINYKSNNDEGYTSDNDETPDPALIILDAPVENQDGLYSYSIYNTDTTSGTQLTSDVTLFNFNEFLTEIVYFNNNNTNITKLDPPNKFENYSNLTAITLPESLVEISNNLFAGCTNLTRINIPKNVSAINETAFINCPALTEITVDNSSSRFSSKNGILYSKDKKTLIRCPEKSNNTSDELKTVLVKDAVKVNMIAGHAFRGVTNLSEINVTDSVISIGSYAFANTGIKKITLPESLSIVIDQSTGEQILPVGEAIFDSLTNATNNNLIIDVKCSLDLITQRLIGNNTIVDLNINDQIKKYRFSNARFISNLSIGLNYENRYLDNEELSDYYSNLYIGEYSFQNTVLNTVHLGNKVYIDNNAFSNCSITNIICDQSNPYFKLDNNVLYQGYYKKDSAGKSIEFIPSRIIIGLKSASTISVKNTVETIDLNAFRNCINLSELIFINNDLNNIVNMPDYPWGIIDTSIIKVKTESSTSL